MTLWQMLKLPGRKHAKGRSHPIHVGPWRPRSVVIKVDTWYFHNEQGLTHSGGSEDEDK